VTPDTLLSGLAKPIETTVPTPTITASASIKKTTHRKTTRVAKVSPIAKPGIDTLSTTEAMNVMADKQENLYASPRLVFVPDSTEAKIDTPVSKTTDEIVQESSDKLLDSLSKTSSLPKKTLNTTEEDAKTTDTISSLETVEEKHDTLVQAVDAAGPCTTNRAWHKMIRKSAKKNLPSETFTSVIAKPNESWRIGEETFMCDKWVGSREAWQLTETADSLLLLPGCNNSIATNKGTFVIETNKEGRILSKKFYKRMWGIYDLTKCMKIFFPEKNIGPNF
jgi:hypothetical protein